MLITDNVNNTIHENNAMGTLVERFGDVTEPLLSSCIPNVELRRVRLIFEPFDLKIHANGTHIIFTKLLAGIAHQNGRLAHPTVPNNKILVVAQRLLLQKSHQTSSVVWFII